jgi:ORF014
VNDKFGLHPEEWEKIRDTLFDAMSKGESPIYELKMNAFLEQTVYKYLRPTDEPISLTDIARRFEPENPSYLIQSWLRSRNTIEFLGEWERNNNRKLFKSC